MGPIATPDVGEARRRVAGLLVAAPLQAIVPTSTPNVLRGSRTSQRSSSTAPLATLPDARVPSTSGRLDGAVLAGKPSYRTASTR